MVRKSAILLAIASCTWASPMGESISQRDIPKIIVDSGFVHRDTILELSKRSSSSSSSSSTPSNAKAGVTLATTKKYNRNGPHALKKVLLKYKIPLPPALAALNTTLDPSMNTKRDGSVVANSVPFDQEYTTPFTIGGQKFLLDIDTGSSDFWVFANSTPKSESAGHNIYTPGKTFRNLPGQTWGVGYGDGSSASGTVGTDIVSIGGVTVTQAVQLPTDLSSSFTQNTLSDGLVGLAFSNMNSVQPTQQNTFFKNAIPSLSNPIFTANLKHYPAIGSYDFGFINSSSISTSVYYVNVTSANGWWEVPAPRYRAGNLQYTDVAGASAIADTGTTIILGSIAMAQNYYAQVIGAQYDQTYAAWLFPCTSTLPSLALSVGTLLAQIPGSYINFGNINSTTCYGTLQGYNGDVYIYGDTFFKAFFTVFDQGNSSRGPRLGIAGHK